MSDRPTQHDLEPDVSVDEQAGHRLCLKCRQDFPSSWAGERVCARCKGRADWRNGSPMPTHSTGRRR